MSSKNTLNLSSLSEKLSEYFSKLRTYGFVIFLLFAFSLYGFIFFRIQTLTNDQPSDSAVSSQVKAAQLPHIDKKVIDQLQSLQDNSVSVQTLFNQARSNPFQ